MKLFIVLFIKLLFPTLVIAFHYTENRFLSGIIYTWIGILIGVSVVSTLFFAVIHNDRNTLSDKVLETLSTVKNNRDTEYRAWSITNLIVFLGLGYTGYMNFAIPYGIALLGVACVWLFEDMTINRYWSEILGYELVHKRLR